MNAQQLIQSLQENPAQVWLFMPVAVLLGALHGLEPGHSKTMMAAFIIAVRGTVFQAVLLGLSAAASHTAVIWILAAVALYIGQNFQAESVEPYFQIGSGVIILGTALWMAWQTRREIKAAAGHHHHSHDHDHEHGQMIVDTGHGLVELSVFEENVPPRFELRFLGPGGKVGEPWPQAVVKVETLRPDGSKEKFTFVREGQAFIGQEPIAEPHEFAVNLFLGHGDHFHKYELMFREDGHDRHHPAETKEYQDAHEKAHADEIALRFSNRSATTGQIVLFGLTGGLIPCPAALSIVLVCLQLKQFTLGFALVLCFSVGLALTLVTVGVAAAWSVHHLAKRSSAFTEWARQAPYLSSGLLGVLSLYMIYLGARAILTHG